MPKLLIADMDGTIIHSEWARHLAEVHVFAYFGSPMSPEDITYFKGRTTRAQFEYAIKKYGWNTTPEECARLKLQFYRDLIEEGNLHTFHGFHDVYDSRDGMIAITTSSTRGEFDAVSGRFGFDGKFLDVVTADDVESAGLKGKPEPDPYILTAYRLRERGYKIAPETEVVEDSTSGVYSAFNSGLSVVGITHLIEPSSRFVQGTIKKETGSDEGNRNFFDPGYSVSTESGKFIAGLDNTNLGWAVRDSPENYLQERILSSGRFRLIHHFDELDRF